LPSLGEHRELAVDKLRLCSLCLLLSVKQCREYLLFVRFRQPVGERAYLLTADMRHRDACGFAFKRELEMT